MKLATRTVGSGSRTAALVHGASMNGDAWREFIPYLLEHDLTLILVDQRGHGDSPRADRYRIEDFAGDLVDTLPTGLDLLIGQSLGGVTAAWASADLKPKRYIGIDPAFAMDRGHRILLPLVGPVQAKLPDRVLNALGMPPKGSPPDALAHVRSQWAKWDPAMLRDVTRSVKDEPFPIAPPSVPSTIAVPSTSWAVVPAFTDALREQGWDVRVVTPGGHDLHIENPAGLHEALRDVLDP